MGMMQEFKEFALKGNVVDMAVGVIIGGAFGKIVSSLVADVLMPPIGLMMGNVNFSELFVALKKDAQGNAYATLKAATDAGAPVIKYGVFLQTVIDFIIVAFVIFMVIRAMNKLTPKKKA